MKRENRSLTGAAMVVAGIVVAASVGPGVSADFGAALSRAEVEAFLRSAPVVDRSDVPIGVTRPERLVLDDGTTRLGAAFKIIDKYKTQQRFERKRPEFGFKDSYKHEIAAYELDKLLGLEMVPPTVERKIGIHTGSVQLWLTDVMSEDDRRDKGIDPPDPEAWNRQMYKIRLFHNLIWDTDYNNVSNVLIDKDFRLYIIDSSRAFRRHKELQGADDLQRFSRSVLERLRALDRARLDEHLGPWLEPKQITALLARRDLILDHADALVSKRGEAAVLYP